jgi:outer membrane protein OmpA-like peptidoglycan-associated protein
LGVDAGVEPAGAQPTSDSVGVDFFAAAQADLARNTQCIDELRVLALRARVYFPSGGLTATQEGIGQARVLGLLAQQCPGVSIRVEGHSDPPGDPVINQRLSLERAQSIVARIAASGIDVSLFEAVGRGSAVPSLVRGAKSSAYYDRRVEFLVVETAQLASLVAPTFGAAAESQFQTAACVGQLQAAVQGASIEYAPRGMTVNDSDMALASLLAGIAANCPEARLRLVGQHSDDPRAREDGSTGRLRSVVLMTELVNAGFPSNQLILGAPSCATLIDGLSDSRVDFEVILEVLYRIFPK